jgi:phage protein D
VTSVGYHLSIGGEAAPAHLLEAVQRIEVEEHATMASIMRLVLGVAVDGSGEAWTIVDEDLFPRMAELELSIAVGTGRPEPVLTAYVIETRTVLSETPGESSLDVVAMDTSVLMNLEERVRPWPNTADSDVAESIFADYGLTAVVDRTEPTRDEDDVVLIQRGTDMQLLAALAERNGFDVYVTTTPGGVEGHFHAPRLDEPSQGVLTVGFGGAGNVAELTVTHDALRPTTARGEHLGADDLQTRSGAAETASLPDLGGVSVLTGAHPRTLLLERTGVTGTAELQTLAQAVVDRSSWAVRAEGQLSTMRYEDLLRARRPVSLRGVGQSLSGTYYVERVLHAFDEDGYTQRFALLRNAVGLSGREDFAEDGGR